MVAGIRQERANPFEIEGRQALFVVNLPPRKIMGVISEGMLVDIEYADPFPLSWRKRNDPCPTERVPAGSVQRKDKRVSGVPV